MNNQDDMNQIHQYVAPFIEKNTTEIKLPEITWHDFLLWVFRLRRRVRVIGPSMYPLLKPGDEVLVDSKAYQQTKPKIGDIVLVMHPKQEKIEIIKRIAKVLQDDRYFLMGDNVASSTDSRSFGAVDLASLRGRVTCRFA